MSAYVLVGDKRKHLKIPDGWEIVQKSDVCKVGDMWANRFTFQWCLAEKDDIGESAADFENLIRKTERKK